MYTCAMASSLQVAADRVSTTLLAPNEEATIRWVVPVALDHLRRSARSGLGHGSRLAVCLRELYGRWKPHVQLIGSHSSYVLGPIPYVGFSAVRVRTCPVGELEQGGAGRQESERVSAADRHTMGETNPWARARSGWLWVGSAGSRRSATPSTV